MRFDGSCDNKVRGGAEQVYDGSIVAGKPA